MFFVKPEICGLSGEIMKLRIILLAFIFVSNVQAEIYTWVDENGNKHFGDVVPNKYRQQSGAIEVKYHKPTDDDVQRVKHRITSYGRTSDQLSVSKKAKHKRKSVKYSVNKESAPISEYEKQMIRYKASQQCFAGCVSTGVRYRNMATANGQFRVQETYQDYSACGHCKSMAKPQPTTSDDRKRERMKGRELAKKERGQRREKELERRKKEREKLDRERDRRMRR